MEIQALRLLITEQDLNEVAARKLPLDEEVRKVRIRLGPEGMYVSGVYRMLVNVAFETLWALQITDGKLTARLADFKALGIPVMLFKSMVMTAVKDAITRNDAIQVDEDVVFVDVDRLLAREGMSVRTNLTRVHLGSGSLVLEAAQAAVGSPSRDHQGAGGPLPDGRGSDKG
jgi:hypothetical protein